MLAAMACKTCATDAALQVCLFCGHPFCAAHRTERDGAPCCTGCNEAEHARRSGRSRPAPARTSDPGALGAAAAGADAQAPPPPPLPEAGWTPLLAGVGAAALTVGYLWWFVGWLLTDVEGAPAWARHAGAGTGGALVFAAVWIIVKSRLS